MDARRWEQVGTTFRAAPGRESEARRSYLDAARGGDDTLRAEVSSLLAGYEGGGLLGEPAVGADGGAPKRSADSGPEGGLSFGPSRDGRTYAFSRGTAIRGVVLITYDEQ